MSKWIIFSIGMVGLILVILAISVIVYCVKKQN